MESFVSIRGVTRRFGSTIAVDAADLEIARGELFALLGPSGCGKTTLLRLIGGLDTPDSGAISLDGRTLNDAGTFVSPEKRNVVNEHDHLPTVGHSHGQQECMDRPPGLFTPEISVNVIKA